MKSSNAEIRYSMLIKWSDIDDAFLVTLAEWEGRIFNPVTHGASYDEAVQNGKLALEDLVALTLERGGVLPNPQYQEVAA